VDTIAALAQAAKTSKALGEGWSRRGEEVLADIQEASRDMADIADARGADRVRHGRW
jgi:hypothetical protein